MNTIKPFYIYAYLRKTASTNGDVGSPYYIGKGKGQRAFVKSKYDRMRVPDDKKQIKVICNNLNEADALQIEMLLVHYYGRIDKGTGCLRNLTDGGEGVVGAIRSPEYLQKQSVAHKGRKVSESAKESSSLKLTGRIKMTDGINEVMIPQKDEELYIAKGFKRGSKRRRKYTRKISEVEVYCIFCQRLCSSLVSLSTHSSQCKKNPERFVRIVSEGTKDKLRSVPREKRRTAIGKRWMKKDVETVYVKEENVQSYLDKGYKFGRNVTGHGNGWDKTHPFVQFAN